MIKTKVIGDYKLITQLSLVFYW